MPAEATLDAVGGYVAAVAERAAVSPSIITTIIAILMQLLSGCVPPPKASQVVSGGGAWGEVLVKTSIMKAGIRPRDPRFGPILGAMQAVAATQTEEAAAAFLSAVG